jgi:hypothetical protein
MLWLVGFLGNAAEVGSLFMCGPLERMLDAHDSQFARNNCC